jgi:hypothetical protein
MRLVFWAVVAFLAGLTFLILSFVDLEIKKSTAGSPRVPARCAQ